MKVHQCIQIEIEVLQKIVKLAPSLLPAIEIAPPGSSYNPTYEDHQDVLGEALAQELERSEKERYLNKKIKSLRKNKKQVLVRLFSHI